MTRGEALIIARQMMRAHLRDLPMVKAYRQVCVVEDLTYREVTIQAINAAGMSRRIESKDQWHRITTGEDAEVVVKVTVAR